jgi:hypothetical protein
LIDVLLAHDAAGKKFLTAGFELVRQTGDQMQGAFAEDLGLGWGNGAG